MEVTHGRGDEIYVNAQGMQVHWIDVLTMSAAALVAILVMLVATVLYERRTKRDAAAVMKLESKSRAPTSERDK